ncbi:MAG: ATP-binding cassette domain-containing protein [Pisciglobus halotolerans]|nr:ATP-binding cassette domain-containing protein [Pisciglobus halotolerans]
MIELKNVTKTFNSRNGQLKAVDNISLLIKKHEIFGVIGESGAGKSTLLRFINALETPDEGQVVVDDVDVQQLTKKDLRLFKKRIGMIFQQFNLLSNKTVEENIQVPLKVYHHQEVVPIETVLDFVGLKDKRHSYPSELSGGQKQRVGIARALITKPAILLCDEPTSALDESTTKEIVHVLKKAHQEFGMTVVIVTHELEVIKELCTRAAVMEKGELVDTIQVKQKTDQTNFKTYHERALEVLGND